MNAHQRRKATRAIRNHKPFRGYSKYRWVRLIVREDWADRQRGPYTQLVRKAFGLPPLPQDEHEEFKRWYRSLPK